MLVDNTHLVILIGALNDTLERQELFSDENDFHAYFELKTNGNVQIVEFLGCEIWDSENDEREIVGTSYEPLSAFIVKQAQKFLGCLQKIKVDEFLL